MRSLEERSVGRLEIRVATLDEVAKMIDWAAAEGWNPGVSDAAAFHAADGGGFLIGYDDSRPVGGISAVRYDGVFGFIGLYIVVADRRARGFGTQLWSAALDRLRGMPVGLDGVVAQQANYRRGGFELAHRNIRYAGVAERREPELAIVDLRDISTDVLLTYERPMFPAARPAFLNAWRSMPHSLGRAVVENERLRGYGVLRACHRGFKIGPLFADNAHVAEALVASLTASAAGQPIALDVPEPNAEAIALALRYGLAPAFETARMYLGPRPDIDLSRVYGITTFELG